MKKLSMSDLIALETYLSKMINKLPFVLLLDPNFKERDRLNELKTKCTDELNTRLNSL